MAGVLLHEMRYVFGQYEQTALFEELKVIIMEFLESIRIEHFHQAESVFNIECLKPFTMANDLFRRGQEEAYGYFFHKRYEARVTQYVKLIDAQQQQTTGKPSRTDPSKVTEKELGPDEFAKELEIMSVRILTHSLFSVSGLTH